MNKLIIVKKLASRHGATDLKKSTRKGKKYMVLYKNKWIHFGSDGMSDFIEHQDLERRHRYRQRHSKILLKDGTPAYKNKNSPAFWSWFILWS